MSNHTMTGIVATAQAEIAAPPARVWEALTEPDQISQYFFGTTVDTDWKPGSPITWRGEYENKAYTDHGTILASDPPRRLEFTHFSPLSGAEDSPENYHTLVYELEPRGAGTYVSLSQDHNASDEEAQRSAANWSMVLDGLKKLTESSR